MHPKNSNALFGYKNITIETIQCVEDIQNYNLAEFDCVYSPSSPVDVSKYPGVRFVFGPHFSVFPDQRLSMIRSPRTSYMVLSRWNQEVWKSAAICDGLDLVAIPFGVDTTRFCEAVPIQQRNQFFIYFKSRHPEELRIIEQIFRSNGMHNYKVFHYEQKYSEVEYLDALQKSKYGIWIGRHESQGFALEEALSCNVPLLVWDVQSMNQEYGQRYADIPATTIPYWDSRCGEVCYDIHDFVTKMNLFIANIESYQPRKYVLENLSIDHCEQLFINMVRQC